MRQGDKLRPIDDFSQFVVNAAFGAGEKVSMKNLDQIVAWSRAWRDSQTESGCALFEDTSGAIWEYPFHDEWSDGSWKLLEGRVADLKQACKQLAAAPAHSAVGVIAVRGPDGMVNFFRARSLMFGQAAAVYGFLRFSRALAALGTSLFCLVLVEFFDDFTQIEPGPSAASAQEAMEGLIKLLGWQLSTSEEKRRPFSPTFVALGVQVDFAKLSEGTILLSNKPGRVENIEKQVREVLEARPKVMSFRVALSLRGKVAFAEGQTFCRMTGFVAKLLSEWASSFGGRKISEELEFGLQFAVDHLKLAGPRVLSPKSELPPAVVFTDGACEDDGTSIGGVLFIDGQRPLVFGCVLALEDVEELKDRAGQKQVIGQAEILPVLVAKLTWQKELEYRRVLFFVDNESAKIALIRAYSPVLSSLKLVMESAAWDYRHQCGSWYSRVPTVCNIADDPSRMVVGDYLRSLGAIVVSPVLPNHKVPARVLK